MSLRDTIKNAAKKLVGRAKEVTGKATGNDKLEAEGRSDQVKANLRQAAEKVKDAFRKR
ncbi:CsbD family protein [Arthrobacter pityocampae]|uniref:CsbD family protein n=1 Tax=Arthrobacter pityocampae TaxID=547334 RepID=A0A2S5J0T5_9MICC|nr:CsbD family protein [Arthrobacter pityocampae]PPB50401.1 CsbD family protein [Arthrobacter pityocampae]